MVAETAYCETQIHIITKQIIFIVAETAYCETQIHIITNQINLHGFRDSLL